MFTIVYFIQVQGGRLPLALKSVTIQHCEVVMARRRSAAQQLHALAWICFCGPGLFNALTSFASGLAQPHVAFAGNALVYLSFAVCSLLATALVPVVGLRRALTLGSLGYVVYAASLWNMHNAGLASLQLYYGACIVLGIAAGFLWTAQGVMLLSYSRTESRGESVSRFWIIFNLGAAAGGVLSFALNFSSGAALQASNAMYVAFLLLMGCGVVLAYSVIVDVDAVERDEKDSVDNGRPRASSGPWWRSWLEGAQVALAVVTSRTHAKVLLSLLPLFVYSNWFYAYHSFYNVAVFNARTSGLTSACYWLAQMAGAHALGRFLDRRMHTLGLSSGHASTTSDAATPQAIARQFLLVFGALATLMWTAGWYVQDSWLHLSSSHRLNMDVTSPETATLLPVVAMYIVYGLHDALCQVWIYWFMSLVAAHDIAASSCYAGVYKCVQATSAAVAWYLGAIEVAPLTQLQINFALCVVSVACAVQSCAFASRGDVTRTDQRSEATALLTASSAGRASALA